MDYPRLEYLRSGDAASGREYARSYYRGLWLWQEEAAETGNPDTPYRVFGDRDAYSTPRSAERWVGGTLQGRHARAADAMGRVTSVAVESATGTPGTVYWNYAGNGAIEGVTAWWAGSRAVAEAVPLTCSGPPGALVAVAVPVPAPSWSESPSPSSRTPRPKVPNLRRGLPLGAGEDRGKRRFRGPRCRSSALGSPLRPRGARTFWTGTRPVVVTARGLVSLGRASFLHRGPTIK